MPIRPAALPEDRSDIDALLHAAGRFDGYVPLTEDGELGYRAGSPGLVAGDGERVTGYAQLRDTGAEVTVEIVVAPECRSTQGRRLLAEAVRAAGDGPVAVWVSDDDMVAATAALGFREQRAVLQLVGELPAPGQPEWPEGVSAATFAVGRDEGALLELNGIAFADHPDNASWDADVLAERMSRDWFDPDGIVTAVRSGRMVGACWTKVHPGRVGEIYWIAVHPDEQGKGIGTALSLAGLRRLGESCRTATVYTEAGNTAAQSLYRRLGFRLLRVKRRMLR
jgi:mycothiol synthase